jgi:hypothetical protein
MIVMVLVMCGALVAGFLSGALTRAHTAARLVFCPCGVTRVCPLGHDDRTVCVPGRGAGAAAR